jgi:hypothetical protein
MIRVVRAELLRQIAAKEKKLADLYPDNFRSGTFLDEADAAVRLMTIQYLKDDLYDMKRIRNALDHCIAKEQS